MNSDGPGGLKGRRDSNPGLSFLDKQDGDENEGVWVSDPVVPTRAPPFASLPAWEGSIFLDREINPRANLTGNVNHAGGGIAGGPDPLLALQADAPPASELPFLAPILNFAGQGYTFVNPPDTVGDVGPNHYIQMINGGGGSLVMIYDKTGTSVEGPWSLDSLNTGQCGSGAGDPVVLYDQMADRWLLSEFSSVGNNNCVYVSDGPDPINDDWYAYTFPSPGFPDYPKYGVWPDAYYISTNESSPAVYALDRTQMLAGQPATSQRFTAPDLSGFGFQALTPSDLDGGTPPPAGSPNYFMRHRDTEAHGPGGLPASDQLEIWAFDVDFAVPANSSFTQINTISIAEIDSGLCGFFAFACMEQPGTSTTLDPLREVVMFRLVYRNFGSHEVLLGNLVTDVDGTDHGGIRWFELRKSGGGAWALHQEGTYAPDGHSRWMGSIAMDASGNIAVGYNVSSSTLFPSLRYAGRLAGDPLGTLPQSEGILVAGSASNGSNRYGDYAAMSIDPADDCTFWFTGQYNTSSSWSTRIGTFKFDNCSLAPDFSVEVSPPEQTVCVPNPAVFDVNVGSLNSFGDPVTLTATGNPAGTTTAFSNNPVIPPGTSVLTVGNLISASFGSYDLNIVGISPTRTHTTTVVMDVQTAPPGTSVLQQPANGASGVSLLPNFSWTPASQAGTYTIEVATDAAFSNVVYTAGGIEGNSLTAGTPLQVLQTNYWRVRSQNECGSGSWSAPFSFTTLDSPLILLVDDDDNAPDVRGTYEGMLTSLGLDYDVWNTANSDNEPDDAELASYKAVIWFTGDEYGGFAGPGAAGELALENWLDDGGCLFLSSQDYHWDRSLTSFMTAYLGVSSVSNDSGNYNSVVGLGEFAGLGAYSLSYPFTDYSDILTLGAGGVGAMEGNNGNLAGTTKETPDYKTAFWAFPWEALPESGREETLRTFLSWCGNLFAPKPVVDLEIQRSGADLQLSWSPVVSDVVDAQAEIALYHVYRHAEPYGTGGTWITSTTFVTYTDPGVASGSTGYYYTVIAENINGLRSEHSNRVGVFLFSLLPGTPLEINE